MCYALVVEPNETKLDPKNMPNINNLLSICARLVVVNKESAIIRLMHYTTQDYFKRIQDL
jgi:hypothetical protein